MNKLAPKGLKYLLGNNCQQLLFSNALRKNDFITYLFEIQLHNIVLDY